MLVQRLMPEGGRWSESFPRPATGVTRTKIRRTMAAKTKKSPGIAAPAAMLKSLLVVRRGGLRRTVSAGQRASQRGRRTGEGEGGRNEGVGRVQGMAEAYKGSRLLAMDEMMLRHCSSRRHCGPPIPPRLDAGQHCPERVRLLRTSALCTAL